MRILLVQPGESNGPGFHNITLIEPLGLESIAAGLTGHDVHLIDLRVDGNLIAALQRYRPEICGINCSFTSDVRRVLEIARYAKASDDAAKPFVVVGGHHASLSPADLHDTAVDAIVQGEGDVSMRELTEALASGKDLSLVPGLILNRGETQVRTVERPPIRALDDLPIPSRHLTRDYRHNYRFGPDWPFAAIESARGCPYRCSFCSVWRFYKGSCRSKSAERVVAEVESTAEPYVLFTDDNFLADPARAGSIAALILQRGFRRHYAMQVRSDSVVRHPEVIRAWRQAGLMSVFIGLEKADDRGLAAINKHSSVENNDRALDLLNREGIKVIGSFIVDPAWERADFAALRQYILSRPITAPYFWILTPLPGTVLHEQAAGQLVTRDPELFDLMHLVLPSSLPMADFYTEFAGLYRASYTWRKVLPDLGRMLVNCVRGGPRGLAQVARYQGGGRRITKPQNYLAAHEASRRRLGSA